MTKSNYRFNTTLHHGYCFSCSNNLKQRKWRKSTTNQLDMKLSHWEIDGKKYIVLMWHNLNVVQTEYTRGSMQGVTRLCLAELVLKLVFALEKWWRGDLRERCLWTVEGYERDGLCQVSNHGWEERGLCPKVAVGIRASLRSSYIQETWNPAR